MAGSFTIAYIPQMPNVTPWYWDDPKNNTLETITCKLTLSAPTGQTAPPPFTLTSHVNVEVPTIDPNTVTLASGVNLVTNPSSYGLTGTGEYLMAGVPGPIPSFTPGIAWTAGGAPPAGSPFTSGQVAVAQVTTNLTMDGTSFNCGLDTMFPYVGNAFATTWTAAGSWSIAAGLISESLTGSGTSFLPSSQWPSWTQISTLNPN